MVGDDVGRTVFSFSEIGTGQDQIGDQEKDAANEEQISRRILEAGRQCPAACGQDDAAQAEGIENNDAAETAVVQLQERAGKADQHAGSGRDDKRQDDTRQRHARRETGEKAGQQHDMLGAEGAETGEGIKVLMRRVDPPQVKPHVAEQPEKQAGTDEDGEGRRQRAERPDAQEQENSGGERLENQCGVLLPADARHRKTRHHDNFQKNKKNQHKSTFLYSSQIFCISIII